MELDHRDLALVGALADGLPLCDQPYAALGATIAMSETEVLERLRAMTEAGIIRRFGVVVRHRELGYGANAMVVWDLPDERVAEVGRALAASDDVTLCYQRPRRLPDWPYNLFCMIHGRDRSRVEAVVAALVLRHGLSDVPHRLLFSTRRFKQRGAAYRRVA